MYYCQYIWQYTLTIFQREESKYDITQIYIYMSLCYSGGQND